MRILALFVLLSLNAFRAEASGPVENFIPKFDSFLASSSLWDNQGNLYLIGADNYQFKSEHTLKVLKFDSAGKLLWTKQYPIDNAYGMAGVAYLDSQGNIVYLRDSLLTKIASDGQLLWQLTKSDIGVEGTYNDVKGIVVHKDSSMTLLYRTLPNDNRADSVVTHFSSAGKLQWSTVIDTGGGDFPEGIFRHGEQIIVSTSSSLGRGYRTLLTHMDLDGHILYQGLPIKNEQLVTIYDYQFYGFDSYGQHMGMVYYNSGPYASNFTLSNWDGSVLKQTRVSSETFGDESTLDICGKNLFCLTTRLTNSGDIQVYKMNERGEKLEGRVFEGSDSFKTSFIKDKALFLLRVYDEKILLDQISLNDFSVIHHEALVLGYREDHGNSYQLSETPDGRMSLTLTWEEKLYDYKTRVIIYDLNR